ncbi:unnamed protein product [Hymenolepis diminuta]|uniref:Secreted protein n=1 Tax=Hymenolepis diminuta TaxID=6216 RepID=A0A158QC39_HYMDI|nr:unnamed protein product [Hymenolepis diminuta]
MCIHLCAFSSVIKLSLMSPLRILPSLHLCNKPRLALLTCSVPFFTSSLFSYVNLGPHSPVSTSATSVTSSATSPATAITSSSSSHSTSNYLSYSPYVPLSRQRSANSGHWRSQGRGRGRMRTLSSGQPSNAARQVALSLINPFRVYFQHSEFSII